MQEGQTSQDHDSSVTPQELERTPVEETGNNRPPTLLIVGGIVVVALIVIGLFLPPISLGQRLGLGGGDTAEGTTGPTTAETATEAPAALPDGVTLATGAGSGAVAVTQVAATDFQSSGEWSAAVSAVPSQLSLAGDVYALNYEGDAPTGQVALPLPAGAGDGQALDLYGWTGSEWQFIPSRLDTAGGQVVSAERALPQALALMEAGALDQPAVAAQVSPAQELPVELLPHLTEVAVGTVTLTEMGELEGQGADFPDGAYDQYLRATNTGVIIDQAALVALLSDGDVRETHLNELVAQSADYAGINLDYQGVPSGQTEAYTEFVRQLANVLHAQDKKLAVTLAPPAASGGAWDTGGQDWQALGQIADVVYVQLPLNPGAYGDNGTAEQLLQWATRQINRYKLNTLVTAGAVDAIGESFVQLANEQALANFGELQFVAGGEEIEPGTAISVTLSGTAGPLEWDGNSLTYRYSYEDDGQTHRVWLGNEAALAHRMRLAARYNVRGVTVSGLGQVNNGAGYAAAVDNFLGNGDAPQPAGAAIVWTVRGEDDSVIASASGSELSFSWEGAESPGNYSVLVEFALGDTVAPLDSTQVAVVEPEEEEEVVEESDDESEDERETASGNVDLGDADAIVTTGANVRTGPGLGYGTIAGGATANTKVQLIGRNKDASWLQVVLPDGQEGWIYASLMTVNADFDVNGLEVVEVDPPTTTVADNSGDGDDGDSGGGAPPPVNAPPVTNAGFELGGQTHSFANPTLMSQSGMNWVKFQHKWGEGDDPSAVAGRIQQAHANGFKVLLSIPGANTYPDSINFDAYVQFLGGVAALGPDAIEVWNEMNIDFEWPAGQINPTTYVNQMLAPAYNAIKAANPNVMVISGAPAPTGFDNGTNAWADDRYMQGVAAAGGANYMDCIGVHHNAGATAPSATSGHPSGSAHYSWYFAPTMNLYYNIFGGSRPVCFTELGYLSGQDFGGVPSRFSWAAGTTVNQHAQWLAQAVSLAASSGKVRMLIVFNVDFTLYGEDPQAGFAMIRPDGSCPACGTLGQVMGR